MLLTTSHFAIPSIFRYKLIKSSKKINGVAFCYPIIFFIIQKIWFFRFCGNYESPYQCTYSLVNSNSGGNNPVLHLISFYRKISAKLFYSVKYIFLSVRHINAMGCIWLFTCSTVKFKPKIKMSYRACIDVTEGGTLSLIISLKLWDI